MQVLLKIKAKLALINFFSVVSYFRIKCFVSFGRSCSKFPRILHMQNILEVNVINIYTTRKQRFGDTFTIFRFDIKSKQTLDIHSSVTNYNHSFKIHTL